MRKTKLPTRLQLILLLPFLIMTPFVVSAAEMPPPPGVLDSYQCVYQPGKDIDDLMSARDFYVKQAAKGNYKTPTAYLWQLAKGSAPVDVVWFDLHENLGAFAASTDAATASAEIAVANARFEEVFTCQSGVASVQTIYQREVPELDAGPGFIASSACMLKHGQSQQNVADLVRHIAGVMEGMGDKAPAGAFIADPITSGPDTPDLYLFSLNPSVTAWSQLVGEMTTNPAGQMLGRHFNTVLDCNMSMWSGQWMIAPEG